jgi:hypothetical protein
LEALGRRQDAEFAKRERVALLKQNTRNPELFGEEISFNKQ